jgi:hypothetical protein
LKILLPGFKILFLLVLQYPSIDPTREKAVWLPGEAEDAMKPGGGAAALGSVADGVLKTLDWSFVFGGKV